MTYIVVFGDSITYGAWDPESGWVARLRRWLEENRPREDLVYNCGISGDSSRELLARFEVEARARFLEADQDKQPKLVILDIGGNDSYWAHDKGGHNVPLEEYRSNIERLLKMARGFTPKVLVMGLPPVDDAKTDPVPWAPKVSYRTEWIAAYHKALKETCTKANVTFVDTFDDWSRADYKRLLSDGTHPNAAGHQRLFEAVRDALVRNKLL
jgi:lysophospholipase L1-like esterase